MAAAVYSFHRREEVKFPARQAPCGMPVKRCLGIIFDMQSKILLRGVAIGIGVAVLTPLVIAALAPALKPVARSALKAGIRVDEKGRETVEVFGETIEDITAEVEEEMFDAHEDEHAESDVEVGMVGSTRK